MIRVDGSHYPRQLKIEICEAIGALRMLEFDYDGYHRVVRPNCPGFTRKGAETLRAVQVNAGGRSGGRGYGKLWTVAKMQNLRVAVSPFDADDPDYNPNDTALLEIHCRVKPAPGPHGSG